MHEIKLTENIVSILEDEVKSQEVGDIKTVHLEVGKLRYVVPDIITSCFEHIPKSEKLKDAKIQIEELPVKIKCSSCGESRIVNDGVYSCSICDNSEIEIVSGKEFRVKGIEKKCLE